MKTLAWTVVGFLLGAVPFSVWLGRVLLGRDIRQYGDGNPGGTNVVRAGGRLLGVLVILLDMLKGALPVGLAYFVSRVSGWALVPVILAPVLGHAFSPFLHGRGGKAIATTFGVWTALTLPFGPFVMGLGLLVLNRVQSVAGWSVLAAFALLLVFLLATGAPLPLLAAWMLTEALLAWKHRADLGRAPALRKSSARMAG